MRLRISPLEFRKFIEEVKSKTGLSAPKLAQQCRVSERTMRDWLNGRYTTSDSVINYLVTISGAQHPLIIESFSDTWLKKVAGKKGGQAVMKKYGNIGTVEGRRLGAHNALATHRELQTGFFQPRKVIVSAYSKYLAEFVGAVLGDGCITKYQIAITLHKNDDREYVVYIAELIKKLFHLAPSVKERTDESVTNIIISRVALIESLTTEIGLRIGNKVKHQVAVPDWILVKSSYIRACLRGLFDTDGCFYIDKHRYKARIYLNCGMNFTNRSMPILIFFKNQLEELGFHPTQKTKYSVFLRKEEEILKYFKIVGSSNPKHYRKFEKFMIAKYGRVPKWT